MGRIPLILLGVTALSGCTGSPPAEVSQFAPRPILTHQAEAPAAAANQGCWTQDPQLGRWIETPCAEDLPEGFVATLQRALAARNLFTGEITGEVDPETRTAIRAYQGPRGLNSTILSLGAAEQLGLIPVSAARARNLDTPEVRPPQPRPSPTPTLY